jgi:hypothetical protein
MSIQSMPPLEQEAESIDGRQEINTTTRAKEQKTRSRNDLRVIRKDVVGLVPGMVLLVLVPFIIPSDLPIIIIISSHKLLLLSLSFALTYPSINRGIVWRQSR